MYQPLTGRVYRTNDGQSYFLITEFKPGSTDNVEVSFQIPGSDMTFQHRGLSRVSDFLHSIELVQDTNSELEKIARQVQSLDRIRASLENQRDFLQAHPHPSPPVQDTSEPYADPLTQLPEDQSRMIGDYLHGQNEG